MAEEMPFTPEEQKLVDRLVQIRDRLEWITSEEQRSAWIRGLAARGHFEKERDALIEETEQVLDRLKKLGSGED